MRTARLLPVSPSMHCRGEGVCACSWGACLWSRLRGVCSRGERGACLWSGLGGTGGVYPSMQWGRPPPCEQNDRQVQKYYLAQTSFAGGNKKHMPISQHVDLSPARVLLLSVPDMLIRNRPKVELLHHSMVTSFSPRETWQQDVVTLTTVVWELGVLEYFKAVDEDSGQELLLSSREVTRDSRPCLTELFISVSLCGRKVHVKESSILSDIHLAVHLAWSPPRSEYWNLQTTQPSKSGFKAVVMSRASPAFETLLISRSHTASKSFMITGAIPVSAP